MYVRMCMYVYMCVFIMFSLRKLNISYKITVTRNCGNRLVGIFDEFMSRDNTDLSFFVTKRSSAEIFIPDLYSL